MHNYLKGKFYQWITAPFLFAISMDDLVFPAINGQCTNASIEVYQTPNLLIQIHWQLILTLRILVMTPGHQTIAHITSPLNWGILCFCQHAFEQITDGDLEHFDSHVTSLQCVIREPYLGELIIAMSHKTRISLVMGRNWPRLIFFWLLPHVYTTRMVSFPVGVYHQVGPYGG